jgi:hypothetical protein
MIRKSGYRFSDKIMLHRSVAQSKELGARPGLTEKAHMLCRRFSIAAEADS